MSSRGEEKWKLKKRIIFEDEKYLVSRREKEKRRKRRTIFEEGKIKAKIEKIKVKTEKIENKINKSPKIYKR